VTFQFPVFCKRNCQRKPTISEEQKQKKAKLDLDLTQIGTLSSQFDFKMSALRQEVTERYQKLTAKLTEDAKNRENHLDAKLKVVTSKVALQQEQLDTFKTDLSHLNSFIELIKSVDINYVAKEVPNLVLGHNQRSPRNISIAFDSARTCTIKTSVSYTYISNYRNMKTIWKQCTMISIALLAIIS